MSPRDGARAAEVRRRFPLRLYAPTRTVVFTEIVAMVFVGVLVWRNVPWPWWVVCGVVVAGLGLVTFKDASVTHWAFIWLRWWRGRKSRHGLLVWEDPPAVSEAEVRGAW